MTSCPFSLTSFLPRIWTSAFFPPRSLCRGINSNREDGPKGGGRSTDPKNFLRKGEGIEARRRAGRRADTPALNTTGSRGAHPEPERLVGFVNESIGLGSVGQLGGSMHSDAVERSMIIDTLRSVPDAADILGDVVGCRSMCVV